MNAKNGQRGKTAKGEPSTSSDNGQQELISKDPASLEEINIFKNHKQADQAKIKPLESKTSQLENEISSYKSQITTLQNQLKKVQKELSESQSINKSLEQENNQTKTDLIGSKKAYKDLDKKFKSLTIVNDQTKKDLLELNNSYQDLDKRFKTLTSENNQTQTDLTRLKNAYKDLDKRFKSLTSENNQTKTNLTSLNNSYQDLDKKFKSLTIVNDQTKKDLLELNNSYQDLDKRFKTLTSENSKTKTDLTRLKNAYKDLDKRFKSLTSENNQTKKDLALCQDELTKSKERCTQFENDTTNEFKKFIGKSDMEYENLASIFGEIQSKIEKEVGILVNKYNKSQKLVREHEKTIKQRNGQIEELKRRNSLQSTEIADLDREKAALKQQKTELQNAILGQIELIRDQCNERVNRLKSIHKREISAFVDHINNQFEKENS